MVVGGRGKRFVSFGSVERSKVHLQTKTFVQSDAMCCPSVEGEATFVLENGQLHEWQAPRECTFDNPCADDD